MTTEEIKEAVKVMEAYADGKKVQRTDLDGNWFDCDNPRFDWASFNYRIKPEPKYRPFQNQEECWNEMHNHPDFGWVRDKFLKSYFPMEKVSGTVNYSEIFEEYEFTDGEPFGIKEE